MSRLPTLTPRKLVAALKQAGYQQARQSGSHLTLTHATRKQVIVPIHARDLKRPLMMKIIRQAGFTDDEFQEFL